MRSAVALLVLLLCLRARGDGEVTGGHETISSQSDDPSDTWRSELQGLRVAMLELREELTARIDQLQQENAGRPKVGFTLGLTNAEYVGPYNTDIILKFTKVFTNIGQAYNTDTGIFTAPVRGMYYFRYTVMDPRGNVWVGIQIVHNSKRLIFNSDYSQYGHKNTSNGVVLQLEQGDTVYLVLPAGHRVYDDVYNHTTFSGFLIFPL